MNIIPQFWTWPPPRLVEGWLHQYPTNLPIVWQAWLTDDPAIWSALVSLLSVEESTRLERLQQHSDRQRFLLGRGLLRLLVGAHLDLPPDRVEFQYSSFGKPFVVCRGSETSLHFNVSHSGKLVLIAFHPSKEVGVDVEEVRASQDWEAVARRMFPAGEYLKWSQLKPEDRATAFFRAWTRHEAGLKTLGLGFSDKSDPSQTARLEYFDLEMPAGYAGAVGCLR